MFEEKEKTMEEILRILELQEEILQFTHFTNADAWELGKLIVAEAQIRDLPVAISIRLNSGATVFQYCFTGTSADNEFWMTRKANTVKRMEKSSLRVYTQLEAAEKTMKDLALNEEEYVCCGGGFPIRVEEVGVIGSIIVSGLNHVADHDLVVKCVAKYLHTDEIPRIKIVY